MLYAKFILKDNRSTVSTNQSHSNSDSVNLLLLYRMCCVSMVGSGCRAKVDRIICTVFLALDWFKALVDLVLLEGKWVRDGAVDGVRLRVNWVRDIAVDGVQLQLFVYFLFDVCTFCCVFIKVCIYSQKFCLRL